MTAQRNLSTHSRAEGSSIEKLSSGSRINHAGDDAAGLSISENMKAALRSERQAIRNTSDGISVIQVAEGAMTEVSNILIRGRELSIQAASDTIGDAERGYLDKELQQLLSEVGRISKSTEFNGTQLLNSGPRYLEIQAGIHNNPDEDRLYFDLLKGNMTPDRLGIGGVSVASKEQAQGNLSTFDTAIERVSKTRAVLGALQNRMAATVRNGEIYANNMAESESRIRDADYANETAEMTREGILANSSLAVLSQANQSGKLALKLLE